MDSNRRHFTSSLIFLAVAISVGAVQTKAQAAAEYTLGTSKAASGAAGFGNIMNRSLSKAANKVSDDLKTSIHESPEKVMQDNRAALEKQAATGGGTLSVASQPTDAKILVDGRLVGRTPAKIKVPAGDHTVTLGRPECDEWTKRVSVEKDQTLEINAKLNNTNPSVISLDFSNNKK